MHRGLFGVIAVGLAVLVAGCSPVAASTPTPSVSKTQSLPVPTLNPSLIPTASPQAIQDVDSAAYLTSWGDYVFKVGDGPVWCTISPSAHLALCEQNQVSADYDPVPIPDTCMYSYGYQVEVTATKSTDGSPEAFMPCSGGSYTDASKAETLADATRITVAPFSCWVVGQTARCDNTDDGSYIALGPKIWALGQATY